MITSLDPIIILQIIIALTPTIRQSKLLKVRLLSCYYHHKNSTYLSLKIVNVLRTNSTFQGPIRLSQDHLDRYDKYDKVSRETITRITDEKV